MNFLSKFLNASNRIEDLEAFIQSNSIELYDFFISQKNSSLISHRKEIDNFILSKFSTYNELDFTDSKNQTFLFCLLDVSQRLGLAAEFQQLYNLAKQNNISLNSRLDATARFLIGINSFDDYENRIKEILSNLSVSFLKEEDNEQKTIATLIHFYTEVFNNFPHNVKRVNEFKDKLVKELQNDEYSFLYTQSVDEILSYSLDNIDELYQAVQTKLDEILERASQYLLFNIEPDLIEVDSHYAELLVDVSANFKEIRDLCAKLYSVVSSDQIFRSLQRGVKVLTEQNQLLAYLNSYGKMHHAKMMCAFEPIEIDDLKTDLEIYDWGCGQGLASICFLEYLNEQKINFSVNKFTLIEPSEIAIKRASLHLKKFASDIRIITINKDLDSLDNEDFENNEDKTKIHLFSNVLDIELFSMTDLINLIKNTSKGKNIFICASPFVSNFKTERLDNFVQSFSTNDYYNLIATISQKKGEWAGTDWSRVIRVFKCWI